MVLRRRFLTGQLLLCGHCLHIRWIVLACLALVGTRPALADDRPITLRIVGGLAGVAQYTRHEMPFWTEQVMQRTHGRVRAEIAPFDRSGIRGPEMLPLMRLGVVPFGTVPLSVSAGDEPEINAVDLPVTNPDFGTLRRTVTLLRPRLEALLKERFNVVLLAVYAYPAQVVFCRQPFSGLGDLSGRRIRVSSVGQSELFEALGAIPVVTPFAEIPAALRGGIVECAVTGSLSGNTLGLPGIATYVSRQAISWGVSVFGANAGAWAALPQEVRSQLQAGLSELQEQIWRAAEQETEEGFACNAGRPECVHGTRGQMVVLDDEPRDRQRRAQLLRDVILPSWIRRCGSDCIDTWNTTMAPSRGILARPE